MVNMFYTFLHPSDIPNERLTYFMSWWSLEAEKYSYHSWWCSWWIHIVTHISPKSLVQTTLTGPSLGCHWGAFGTDLSCIDGCEAAAIAELWHGQLWEAMDISQPQKWMDKFGHLGVSQVIRNPPNHPRWTIYSKKPTSSYLTIIVRYYPLLTIIGPYKPIILGVINHPFWGPQKQHNPSVHRPKALTNPPTVACQDARTPPQHGLRWPGAEMPSVQLCTPNSRVGFPRRLTSSGDGWSFHRFG